MSKMQHQCLCMPWLCAMIFTTLVFQSITGSSTTFVKLNQQPIVGVLAVPIGKECITIAQQTLFSEDTNTVGSCFHSLYVQWLESAGARVVPIPYDLHESELLHLLQSLNGVLFTGGEVELQNLTSPYMTTASFIVNYSIAQEAEDSLSEHSLPIWGTCMGFQTLCVLAANDPNILTEGIFDAEGISLPLLLTHEGRSSRLWKGLNPYVQNTLENQNVTCNLHHDGIFVKDFKASTSASAAYTVISTNFDRRGHEFVSTIEHKNAPIFACQWHPERPQFQFSDSAGEPNINHSVEAIEAMQAVANFFVAQTKKNLQHFANKSEPASRLIYNYSPHGPEGDSYQAYLFVPSIESSEYAQN